jgi:hypothetical protein
MERMTMDTRLLRELRADPADRIRELDGEVARLREALRPFVEIVDSDMGRLLFAGLGDDEQATISVRLGVIRAAARLVESKGE